MKRLFIMGIVVMSAMKIQSLVTDTIAGHVKIMTYVLNASKKIPTIINLSYLGKQRGLLRLLSIPNGSKRISFMTFFDIQTDSSEIFLK